MQKMQNNQERKSNYELFKEDALRRFMTYDQEKLIRRLELDADESYIYTECCGYQYRFSRQIPLLEKRNLLSVDMPAVSEIASESGEWMEAGPNDVLTLCDLLCHTEDPIRLSADFVTLSGLNRVQGGTTSTSLGSGMLNSTAKSFDRKPDNLRRACEILGGIPAGKGDVAYEIPFFGPVHIRLSFYESDDEFDAVLTIYYPAEICCYMHYETLYYAAMILLDRLTGIAGEQ